MLAPLAKCPPGTNNALATTLIMNKHDLLQELVLSCMDKMCNLGISFQGTVAFGGKSLQF